MFQLQIRPPIRQASISFSSRAGVGKNHGAFRKPFSRSGESVRRAKATVLGSLSARQQEILEAMARGLTSADIAKQLGISHDMVREHATALYRKIGAANRTEAVAIALRKHLLKI